MSDDHHQPPHSMVQAVGNAAGDIVSGLKSQPLMLALVVLQVLTIGSLLYSSTHRQEAISAQFNALHELLGKCMDAQHSHNTH